MTSTFHFQHQFVAKKSIFNKKNGVLVRKVGKSVTEKSALWIEVRTELSPDVPFIPRIQSYRYGKLKLHTLPTCMSHFMKNDSVFTSKRYFSYFTLGNFNIMNISLCSFTLRNPLHNSHFASAFLPLVWVYGSFLAKLFHEEH